MSFLNESPLETVPKFKTESWKFTYCDPFKEFEIQRQIIRYFTSIIIMNRVPQQNTLICSFVDFNESYDGPYINHMSIIIDNNNNSISLFVYFSGTPNQFLVFGPATLNFIHSFSNCQKRSSTRSSDHWCPEQKERTHYRPRSNVCDL